MEKRQMKFRAWIGAEYIGEETGVMHTSEAADIGGTNESTPAGLNRRVLEAATS